MKTDNPQHSKRLSDYQVAERRHPDVAQTASPPPASQNPASIGPKKLVAPAAQKPTAPKPGRMTTLGEYNAYAKYASTITRQLLFGESRYQNSKLVIGTVLSKLQVKGGIVPPGIRLGTLGLTRLNSAIANFSKAGTLIASADAKIRAGQDATDDIVSATALMGEGLTEIFAGLGADVGNYLVRQWQAQLGKTSSSIGSVAPPSAEPSEVIHEAGTGTPIPQRAFRSDLDAALAHLPPMSPQQHEELMEQGIKTYNAKLDAQLKTMRESEIQSIVAALEKTPEGNQPARLQQLAAEAQARIETAEQIAAAAKRNLSVRHAQSESDFMQLETKMKDIREQLKSGKYTDIGVAGLAREDAARNLGAQLLAYRRREEELAQSFETLAEDTAPDLGALGQQLEIAKSVGNMDQMTKEEKIDKLQKLKTDFRTRFVNYQNAISEPTANLPEWAKISPALKAQLGPAALNTAFAAADFGARLDDYIKKVANGTVTETDKWNLAGSTIGLIGGMSSFIPIVGPIVSIALALVGVGVSNMGEQLSEGKIRDANNALRDAAVDEYQKKHPGSENYVYKSDVGAG